jgi:hypothetical protein
MRWICTFCTINLLKFFGVNLFYCLMRFCRLHALKASCVVVSRAWKKAFSQKQQRYPLLSRFCSWISTSATELLQQVAKQPVEPCLPTKASLWDRAQKFADGIELLLDAGRTLEDMDEAKSFELLPSTAYSFGIAFRKMMTSHGPLYKLLESERKQTTVSSVER